MMNRSMHWSRWFAAAMLLCMGLTGVCAAELPAEPLLRIEAGMHTASLRRIATDRTGRYAVTASHDKTARVWDVASGRLLRVLRPPIGEDDEGKLYAVAITPDGETVAVGGWTGWDWRQQAQVYLFDRATGRLRQRLTGLPNVIHDLAFSLDGRWLAAGLGDSNGVRVWDWRSGGMALADSDVKEDSYSASWSNDHRLATTSYDGQIRLYRVELGRLAKLAQAKAPGGQQPYGIAFSPDGRELAVGYSDSTRIDILDSRRLTLKHSPSSSEVNNSFLANVAWSADGRTLYAGGKWSQAGRWQIRRWPEAGRDAAVDVPTVGATVMSLATLAQEAGGGVLVGGSDPAWGVLDAAGRWQLKQASPIADLRDSLAGFRLSGDGREVQFGFERGGNAPHRFALARRELKAGAADSSLVPARTEGLSVKDWEDTRRPTLAGQPIKLDANEMSRSLAIAPGNAGFVLGTDYWLRRFDAAGKELWQRAIPGIAWGVNIPASGQLVVAAYDDGTIRWHRLSDGQELLAFFPHADRKRWVLWTPSGYYDASPGGEDLIGWHVNRGEDQAADFFPASRFRERFWRPDIIDTVLETLDEGQAIARADQQRGTRAQTASVAQVLPPVVELVSASEVSTSQPQLTLRYRVRSAADAPVTGMRVRVNGQAQPEARNLEVQAAGAERTVTVDVPAQDSQVQVFVENRHGISTAATVRVKWTGTAASPAAVPATAGAAGFQNRPKLYVLAIGVSTYQHRDIARLSFAAKDAGDFAEAMKRQKGKLYQDVEVKLVTEAEATRDNIADALDWLQRQVTQHDVGMLFFSGHGLNDPGMGYTFLPVNADPDKLKRTGVTMADIRSTLSSMPGKVVAFLDTCHSGNVFGSGTKSGYPDLTGVLIDLTSAENGVIVFSSSTGRQLSLENKAWNNGAFTKALVEGIDGKGDLQGNGRVTFKTLDVYVTGRVKELTNGRQSPVTQAPGGVNDFPLAVVAR